MLDTQRKPAPQESAGSEPQDGAHLANSIPKTRRTVKIAAETDELDRHFIALGLPGWMQCELLRPAEVG